MGMSSRGAGARAPVVGSRGELSFVPFRMVSPDGASCGSKRIFFVDDDAQTCQATRQTLRELSYHVTYFSKARECLDAIMRQPCDLLICEVDMPDMGGMEVLAAVKQMCPLMPVVLITDSGEIPMAVKAVKAGAYDFIQKPLKDETFVPVVKKSLEQVALADAVGGRSLTSTERRILQMIVDGKGNKEMAYSLSCSVRTVENHRYRLMHKLNVDGTASLVRLAITTGLVSSGM